MPVILITGIQAAGKSSVAQAVAERLDRSVHLRGDVFRRMIVNGRASMGPADPPDEAVRQSRLRYRLAAQAADGYAEAGFTVVLQDIVLGSYLSDMVASIEARPLYVVVLAPRPAVAAQRETARDKTAYKPGDEGPAELDAHLRRETPPMGLWLDTSEQTLEQTVDELLTRVWTEGLVTRVTDSRKPRS
jgi:chloramphenicol 3-O-phosphotransferase